MSHIFGKGTPMRPVPHRTSRKEAIRDAEAMQKKFEDMKLALSRTMYACEFMGKILDLHKIRDQKTMSEIEEILSGEWDEKIAAEVKAARDLSKESHGKEGCDVKGIRESLSGSISASGGEGVDREEFKAEESGDRAGSGIHSSLHEGI